MASVRERFDDLVDRSSEHHEWRGAVDRAGTPQFRTDGRLTTARRVAWELEHGALPDGERVVACAGHPGCVRVDHLQITERQTELAPRTAAPRRRGRRGDGWIREVRPGVWRVTVSARDADNNPCRRSQTVEGSRDDAARAAALLVARAGGPASSVDVLVRSYLAELDADGHSRHTLRRYRQLWRDWLSPALGGGHPTDVRRSDVATVLTEMADAGQSMSSIRQAATLLNGCYQWAIAAGKVSASPILGVPLPDGTSITGARRRSAHG